MDTRIAAIDGLRGAAALVVVFHHVFKLFPELFEPLRLNWKWTFALLSWISDLNTTAVLLFFVVSGFVIALAVQRYDLSTTHDIKRYASGRAARILPLYWGSLAFSAIIGTCIGMQDPSFSLRDLLGNILFLQTSGESKGNWFVPFALNGPYWSLSYEVFYYALCSFLVLSLGGVASVSRRGVTLVAGSACASIAAIAISQVVASPFTAFMTLSAVWMCGFAIGISNSPSARGKVLATMAAVMGSFLVLEHGIAQIALRSQTFHLLIEGVAMATVYGAVYWFGDRAPGVRAFKALLSGPLAWVGTGSYALYLLHYPALLLLRSLAPVEAPLRRDLIAGLAIIFFFAVLWICPWLEAWSLILGRRVFAMKASAAHSSSGPPS